MAGRGAGRRSVPGAAGVLTGAGHRAFTGSVLLELFSRFGRRAYRYRRVFWWLALSAGGIFCVGLFVWNRTGDEIYSLLAVTFCLWMLLLIVVAETFSRPLPTLDPAAPWLARTRTRIVRGGLWVLALLMTALCGFVLLFSFRALGVVLREALG